jgi:hypothetical protein
MPKLIEHTYNYGKSYRFFCPGCGNYHMFDVRIDGAHPSWTFDGNMERPTFSPSLLCNPNHPPSRCHLFLKGGMIEFLGDCHHRLAGQTVELLDDETAMERMRREVAQNEGMEGK